MAFWKDLEFGKRYEQKAHALYTAPITVAPDKLFTPYDFITGNGLRIEVKADRVSHATGNLFIETKCSGKDSGINATEADEWVYFVLKPIDSNYIIQSVYKIPVVAIKQIMRSKHFKTVKGPDNSYGLIIPSLVFSPFKLSESYYSLFPTEI